MSWLRRNQRPRRQDPEDRVEESVKSSVPHTREDERDFYNAGGYEAAEEAKDASREEKRAKIQTAKGQKRR